MLKKLSMASLLMLLAAHWSFPARRLQTLGQAMLEVKQVARMQAAQKPSCSQKTLGLRLN